MNAAALAGQRQEPLVSVLIARASTEDRARIFETLQALREQDCEFAFEVILVDRLADAITGEIERRFPAVQLVRSEPQATLPQMRTAALGLARGALVAVTEDHCVPCRGWLRALVDAIGQDPQVVAAGGCVANGITASAFDWATYLCEYASFAAPLAPGPQPSVPGMNIAYRRRALLAVPPTELTRGFWETTVHPRLLQGGGRFVACDAALVLHCKHFSLRWFLLQRYAYSRYFAGIRFRPGQWPLRIAAALLCPVLPPLLLARLAAVVRRKHGLLRPALRALPCLLLFHMTWALGEAVGYLRGPGVALRTIE